MVSSLEEPGLRCLASVLGGLYRSLFTTLYYRLWIGFTIKCKWIELHSSFELRSLELPNEPGLSNRTVEGSSTTGPVVNHWSDSLFFQASLEFGRKAVPWRDSLHRLHRFLNCPLNSAAGSAGSSFALMFFLETGCFLEKTEIFGTDQICRWQTLFERRILIMSHE